MAAKGKFEDLNLSKDEITRIGEALKKEEFRKLLVEYAQEISDPENKRRYEEEIAQMENERGMNVSFINPNAGYVLKTSVDGEKKAFINICTNDKIDKPKSEKQTKDGRRGLFWNIPHSFAPPKEDVDKEGRKCNVYDVVYHPDTFRMAETNKRFKKMVEDIAFGGIEQNFNVKLDRSNVKRPKLKNNYKGIPQATVVRSRKSDAPQNVPDNVSRDGPLKDIPYPYENKSSDEKMKEREAIRKKEESENKKNGKMTKASKSEKESHTKPKYTITHRSDMDLQEYRNAPDAKTSTRPKELEIKVELPLITSAAAVNLDVFEKNLKLESRKPAAYKLDLNLPYSVDENNGSAKFDKSKRCLVITLPVVAHNEPLPQTNTTAHMNGDENQIFNKVEEVNTSKIDYVEETTVTSNGVKDDGDYDDDHLIQESSPQLSKKKTDCTESSDNFEIGDHTLTSDTGSISYSLPQYTFHQDVDTVTFVLSVKNVEVDNITKSFPTDNICHIKFVSMGTGHFPLHYSLYVKFSAECRIAVDNCHVDVSEENLVLLLLKNKCCRVIWNGFEAGKDESDVQEKFFITQSSLQKELETLESEVIDTDTMVNQNGKTTRTPSSSIRVTQMNEKTLTIKIKKSDSISSNDDDEAYDADWPSSADIEVVHSKTKPNMHSILKQRTVSESSDDYLSNSYSSASLSSSSPRYCSDDAEHPLSMKKRVSFNEHIDHTTYKPAKAVTSMTTALKSKRRHARKKEEKKKEREDRVSRRRRRRQNSGGSSSGDDQCSSEDSRSGSLSEEHEVSSSIKEEDSSITLEAGDKDVEEESVESMSKPIDNIKANAGDTDMQGECSKSSSKAVNDIKSKAGDTDIQEGGIKPSNKTLHDIRTKLIKCENIHETQDSDDDDCDKDRTKNGELLVLEPDATTDSDQFRTNNGDPSNLNQSPHRKYAEGEAVMISAEDISQSSDVKNIIEANCDESLVQIVASKSDKSSDPDGDSRNNDVKVHNGSKSPQANGDSLEPTEKVETILSWKEGPIHKPQCPFQLSNSVMFDLDID